MWFLSTPLPLKAVTLQPSTIRSRYGKKVYDYKVKVLHPSTDDLLSVQRKLLTHVTHRALENKN